MDVNENGEESRNNGTLEYLNIEARKDSLGSLFQHSLIDDLVKSRHSRSGRNAESSSQLKKLDSRFLGNDRKNKFPGLLRFHHYSIVPVFLLLIRTSPINRKVPTLRSPAPSGSFRNQ